MEQLCQRSLQDSTNIKAMGHPIQFGSQDTAGDSFAFDRRPVNDVSPGRVSKAYDIANLRRKVPVVGK